MKIFADPPSCKMNRSYVNPFFYCTVSINDLPTPLQKGETKQVLVHFTNCQPATTASSLSVNVRTNIVMKNTKNTNGNQNSTNKSVGSTYNAIPATAAVVLAIKIPPTSPSVPPTTQYWGGAITTGEEAESPPASSATSMRL